MVEDDARLRYMYEASVMFELRKIGRYVKEDAQKYL